MFFISVFLTTKISVYGLYSKQKGVFVQYSILKTFSHSDTSPTFAQVLSIKKHSIKKT